MTRTAYSINEKKSIPDDVKEVPQEKTNIHQVSEDKLYVEAAKKAIQEGLAPQNEIDALLDSIDE